MQIFRRYLRVKLMGHVLLPLFAGAALTAVVIHRQNEVVASMAPLTDSSRLGAATADLVHALQLERGSTHLHLGTKAQGYRAEVQSARALVDAKAAAFRELLPKGEPAPEAKAALAQLQPLADLRRGAEAKPVLEAYTAMIRAQLDLLDALYRPAEGTPLHPRFQALSALMQEMEHAGLERAVLAGSLSGGGSAQERLRNLVAAQEAWGALFRRTAPPAWRQAHDRALQGAFAADFARLRDTGLQEESPSGDAARWFRLASERMEALRTVEDGLGRELVLQADRMEGSARATRLSLILVALAFGTVVMAWTHFSGKALLRPIQELESGLVRLREGDLTVRLTVEGEDETARMTEAFNATCQHLAVVVRRLKEAARKVEGGAQGLSVSADQVNASAQALARSAMLQRQAGERVAAAVLQLGASVQQVEESVEAARGEGRKAVDLARHARELGADAGIHFEGIRERAGKVVQASSGIADLSRRLGTALDTAPADQVKAALERCVRAAEGCAALGKANGAAVEAGHARLAELAMVLESAQTALSSSEILAREITQATLDQAAANREVSQRMKEGAQGTTAVQLAAAQLANTVPEVYLTAKELVGVAHALTTAAEAFEVG